MTERARPALRPLPGERADVAFCGYCGVHASPDAWESVKSRVCEQCRMGLVLSAEAALAPTPTEAFLVVDEVLAVRALSARAEKLLDVPETAAVNRQVSELLVPADTSPQPRASLPALLAQARLGGPAAGDELQVTVRPPDVFGVRYLARIGPCRPGPATLVVLTEEL